MARCAFDGVPCDCGRDDPGVRHAAARLEGVAVREQYEALNGVPSGLLKDTNPKDAVGVRKVWFSTVSALVLAEVALGMGEGARKYGRHNYRVAGIRTSVYYDAALRHLMAFWEGEDVDPDSGLSHVTKAICTLFVLRDAMLAGKVTDDRPPIARPPGWLAELNAKAGELVDRYPDAKPPFTKADNG